MTRASWKLFLVATWNCMEMLPIESQVLFEKKSLECLSLISIKNIFNDC